MDTKTINMHKMDIGSTFYIFSKKQNSSKTIVCIKKCCVSKLFTIPKFIDKLPIFYASKIERNILEATYSI